MDDPTDSPRLVKPVLPPLMKQSFTRLARPLFPLPNFFAKSICPFRINQLPQLPPLYDTVLAAIITSEPEPEDTFGEDKQTWNEGKHTLLSLAERGFKYFESRVTEKVQDLAPGPFKDRQAISAIIHTMITVETLALLGCCYAFPKPSSEPTTTRDKRPVDGVKHACDMFMAYIGASRVPYRHNEELAIDIIQRLDKYLDDLISPKVWIKLDDLVKARSRGEKFGEQQLLNPQKKSLAERMTRNVPSPTTMDSIETQVPSFRLNTPSVPYSSVSRSSPSLLHSPTTHRKPLRSGTIPTGPRSTLPPRPISPNTSNSDLSENGVGAKRSRQRNKRGSKGGPMDQSQRGQGGLRLQINFDDRWFEK